MSWIYFYFFCSRPLAAGASCAEMASDGDDGEGGRIVKAQPSIMSRGSRQEVNGKRSALFEERGDQREPLEGHEEESGKKEKSPRSPDSWAEKDGGPHLLVWMSKSSTSHLTVRHLI